MILFYRQKKIEFINRVHQTEVCTKKGVYFASPSAKDHQFMQDVVLATHTSEVSLDHSIFSDPFISEEIVLKD